ncbi:MAG: hypothetical protein ACH350_04570 [Parachlamydiaceae bacterium]
MHIFPSKTPFYFPPFYSGSVDQENDSVDFCFYLNPFIDLISRVGEGVILDSISVVVDRFDELRVIFEIFHRLIFAPVFDPTSSSFKKEIDQLQRDVEGLQKQIESLPQRFQISHLYMRDLKDFKRLSEKIHQGYSKLSDYHTSLKPRIDRYPIQDQLETVLKSYQELENPINDYWSSKGDYILTRFKEIASFLDKGKQHLTQDLKSEVSQGWEDLKTICLCRMAFVSFSHFSQKNVRKYESINEMMQILVARSSLSEADPLSLNNIGNSCYLASFVQSLLCIDYFRDRLSQIPKRRSKKSEKESEQELEEQYQKELRIHQEILKLIEDQKMNQSDRKLTSIELILLMLGNNSSVYGLRKAIFDSEFHPDLQQAEIGHQHDPAYLVEIFIQHFLSDCVLHSRGHACTEDLPGLEFLNGGKDGKDERLGTLPLCLSGKNRTPSLSKLIAAEFAKKKGAEGEYREFELKDGMIIKGKEEEAKESLKKGDMIKVEDKDRYTQWNRLTKLPPVLTIQIKRFQGGLNEKGEYVDSKDDRSVRLPDDGILDLSDYYDAQEGESVDARYRIKSMIKHIGSSLHFGHFISFVEIKGKYYECDDLNPPDYFQEISKSDFFDCRQPYLLFLERVSDDEVNDDLIEEF